MLLSRPHTTILPLASIIWVAFCFGSCGLVLDTVPPLVLWYLVLSQPLEVLPTLVIVMAAPPLDFKVGLHSPWQAVFWAGPPLVGEPSLNIATALASPAALVTRQLHPLDMQRPTFCLWLLWPPLEIALLVTVGHGKFLVEGCHMAPLVVLMLCCP